MYVQARLTRHLALGTETNDGQMKGTLLTQKHSGMNPLERRRIRTEHPGEPDCMRGGRVLGAITVTRGMFALRHARSLLNKRLLTALGDFAFKLPAEFTRKVVLNVEPHFRSQRKMEELAERLRTPPYISSEAEISHHVISEADRFLILSSDGLSDLYPRNPNACTEWVQSVVTNEEMEDNMALRILRNALGGSEEDVVSRHLTVEMEGQWMDDTTILVLNLRGIIRDI